MSIVIGNLTNENINDNRLKFNSYNDSNIININIDGNSYNDAIINYKNIGEIGISNSFIAFNYNNSNIFKANDKQSFFINDIVIKSNVEPKKLGPNDPRVASFRLINFNFSGSAAQEEFPSN